MSPRHSTGDRGNRARAPPRMSFRGILDQTKAGPSPLESTRVVTETAVRSPLAFDAPQSQEGGVVARHMAWSTHGDLLLLAHDEHRPADDEWRSWLRAYETRSPHIRGVLVRTLGSGPSSSQRKELVQAMQAETIPTHTAILTSSAIVRGVLTA